MKLITYPMAGYNDFINGLDENTLVYPVSAMLTEMANIQFVSFKDTSITPIIDITAIVQSAKSRDDLKILYESWINAFIENNKNISFCIEETYSFDAYSIFRNYFYNENPDSDKSSDNKLAMNPNYEKRNISVYNEASFEAYCDAKRALNINVVPISNYLEDRASLIPRLSLNTINTQMLIEVDITSAIKQANRVDSPLDLEILINSFFAFDNVSFSIESSVEEESKNLLRHFFDKYEHFEKQSSLVGKVPLNKSIVAYSQNEFEQLINTFNNRLFGHTDFKQAFEHQLKSFILLNKMRRKKVFSVLLCGKSGIGKTEVARILHNTMYPDSLPIKINFGNYSGKGSLWSLIGSPKGYIGSEQGGELTNKIKKSQSKIILIDELDKADESIFTFFYEMLEDGQFTDLDENLISIDGYIVIFTANLSNQNFKEKIPEPLFSRFDMSYECYPLSPEDIEKFKVAFITDLLNDYIQIMPNSVNIEDTRQKLSNIDFSSRNNLRNIRRDIMNKFVEVIGLDGLWNNSECDSTEFSPEFN